MDGGNNGSQNAVSTFDEEAQVPAILLSFLYLLSPTASLLRIDGGRNHSTGAEEIR
jgi:hypothetical protein